MNKITHRFAASALTAGAVSKDGEAATIEFEAGDERLWLTLPVEALKALARLASELETLSYDAKNGVTGNWHIAPQPPEK